MTILEQIESLAEKHNIEVEINHRWYPEINFYAPIGFCFEEDLHCSINENSYHEMIAPNFQRYALKQLKELVEIMHPCNCEQCKKAREDEQITDEPLPRIITGIVTKLT